MTTAQATQFDTKRSPWWLLLMGGILSVIIGVLLLTSPAKTVLMLVWVLGFYWIIQGMFTLVAMFVDHSAWGWKLFIGILSIIAGMVVLRHPIASGLAIPSILILILGIQGLIVGVVSLVMAFKGGGVGAGILGVLSIIFGLILVLNFAQLTTVIAFIWVVAIFALVGGVVQIVHAFQQRNE